MGKSKKLKGMAENFPPPPSLATTSLPKTLTELRQSPLWFKLCVLVHDLANLSKDSNAEKRTLGTTDELYISLPYFSSGEAICIKSVTVEAMPAWKPASGEWDEEVEDLPPLMSAMSAEDAIKTSLANFFDKRRASGDSRPCGPHDMAPVYQRVFGIDRAEIEDDRFLGRLRKSGLEI